MRMNGIVVLVRNEVDQAARQLRRPRAAQPAATISQRVSVKAVKTVVTMPMASVTAKPRTGPEPR